MGLHDRHDQPVIRQEPDLLAQSGGRGKQNRRESQHLEVTLQNALDGLTERSQLLHLGGVGPQPVADPRERPAEEGARLDGHEPMRDLAQHMGGGKACKLLVLDALQQVGARRSPNRMGLKVIGQRAWFKPR